VYSQSDKLLSVNAVPSIEHTSMVSLLEKTNDIEKVLLESHGNVAGPHGQQHWHPGSKIMSSRIPPKSDTTYQRIWRSRTQR
jgi:hypothetical protein